MLRHTPYWLSAAGAIAGITCISPAKAILTYNIFQSGGDVVVSTTGSLTIGDPLPNDISCINPGSIFSVSASICTGPSSIVLPIYAITGPASFNGTVAADGASSVAGLPTALTGNPETFLGTGFIGLPSTYPSGSPIISSATFSSTTLATLGFTTTGPIGTWTLTDGGDVIHVVLGPPEPAAVPGPLPLLGAGAAFSFSRRLRRRDRLSRSAPGSRH
ncbi:MAG: hypothetical protein VKK62_08650 [Synechococcaceae cyanobacterium]|nr:hypothetical protein [Synechococcaceae cyanobacterium]